jgi:hypothetical protein
MSNKSKWGIGIGIGILVVLLLSWFGSRVMYSLFGATGSMAPSYEGEVSMMSDRDASSFSGDDIMKSVASQMAQNTVPESGQAQDRLIIKTANMSVVVEDVSNAISAITNYAIEKGGFVVTSNVEKYGTVPSGYVTVRIPVADFDASITKVGEFGEVTSKTIQGQDVTEEFVDLDAQLKNLRATENQFLEIMKKATKIEDILAVQRELSNVRGQIDSIEGRMKYLQQSADLSTLTVYLSTDPSNLPIFDESDTWKPWAQVKEAARSLLELGKGLVNFVIWIVVYIPFWFLLGLVVWMVVKIGKRIINKKNSDEI